MPYSEKPPLDELAHYGVKGMKWGQTNTSATAGEITSARRRLRKETKAYRTQSKKLGSMAEGTPARRAFEKKLVDRHQAYLKSPDRVIAARMTRGEKVATVLLSGQTPMTLLAGAANIGVSSAISRTIEYKQSKGAYDKMPSGGPKKRIGFQGAGRSAVVLGAQLGPGILRAVGPTLAKSIGTRAAAKRAAAQVVSPKGIGSIASKIKYVKPKSGIHTITTMK